MKGMHKEQMQRHEAEPSSCERTLSFENTSLNDKHAIGIVNTLDEKNNKQPPMTRHAQKTTVTKQPGVHNLRSNLLKERCLTKGLPAISVSREQQKHVASEIGTSRLA